MILVNNICELLTELKSFANDSNENIDNFYVGGYFAEGVSELLGQLTKLVKKNNLAKHFILLVDGQRVTAGDTLESHCAEFELTFKKKAFIQEICSGAGDIDEILFCSVDALEECLEGLGLTSPLLEGAVNNSNNTRIHVYKMSVFFGGPKLAVIPVHHIELGEDWLSGSRLPSSEIIHKHVHVVCSEPLKINPRQFELTWGDIDCKLAKPYRTAFAKNLFVSLCTNYYSDSKLEFKGVKHLEAELKSAGVDIPSERIKTLSDCICWCYDKEDPDVPLQLVIDRLSLECGSGNLFEVGQKVLSHALEQAKNNYKFVIAKRSDDYRKELKEIFNDIQTVTDKFALKAFSLASELLKSMLTIGFIFTVGTISKAVVNNALLHSDEGIILFKIAGIYLSVSFFIRWLNASADLKVSEMALKSWSGMLHNHISVKDLNKLIDSHLIWSKFFYWGSLFTVGLFQLGIAYMIFNSTATLKIFGL
ncbi:hypothetical protein [Paraglaciecola chathamensis]|uniref:Uncharacterized protein n=1 Tax=Paraglaciecola chathamensis S18K6 TaxID=1127672 RepID=A0AAV3V6B6_9ALTE|nr:hypothetical protein [Paraglaciecola chathamensis]GAC12224.1 hypothetical protein GCHA_4306 [Paraglaciecola chathamensis S18K6]